MQLLVLLEYVISSDKQDFQVVLLSGVFERIVIEAPQSAHQDL